MMPNLYSYYIISCFLFMSTKVSAHQDRYYTFETDNIIVRIKTGHDYEEVEKANILSRMIRDLSNNLEYCKNIQFDFIHDYTYDRKSSDFFVSYKKSKVIQKFDDEFLSENMNDANLIFRYLSTEINFEDCLKYIESSIINEKFIKINQTQYEYDGGYNQWILYSISDSQSKSIMDDLSFYATQKVMTQKYYENEDESNASYYYFNGFFNFLDVKNRTRSVIHKSKKLFQIEILDYVIVIAETPCNIYFYDDGKKITINSLQFCEGSWNILNVKQCSESTVILNYRTGTSEDPNDYFRGISIMVEINASEYLSINSFECN